MTVNIYTTSGGSTPETHTNIISVTVSDDSIFLTEKTANDTKSAMLKRNDLTSVTISRSANP